MDNVNTDEVDRLVSRSQLEDKEAFGELYDIFLDSIYRFVFFKVSSVQLAEDITADIFLKALNKINTYNKKKDSSFSAWIFKIARNTVIDYYRTKKDLHEIPEDLKDESALSDSSRKVEQDLDRKRLLEALKKLPDNQAQAIALKYLSDMSNADIAVILDKTEGAIRIMQSRGIQALKNFLEK